MLYCYSIRFIICYSIIILIEIPKKLDVQPAYPRGPVDRSMDRSVDRWIDPSTDGAIRRPMSGVSKDADDHVP